MTLNFGIAIVFMVAIAITLAMAGITIGDWELWVIIGCVLFIWALGKTDKGG